MFPYTVYYYEVSKSPEVQMLEIAAHSPEEAVTLIKEEIVNFPGIMRIYGITCPEQIICADKADKHKLL